MPEARTSGFLMRAPHNFVSREGITYPSPITVLRLFHPPPGLHGCEIEHEQERDGEHAHHRGVEAEGRNAQRIYHHLVQYCGHVEQCVQCDRDEDARKEGGAGETPEVRDCLEVAYERAARCGERTMRHGVEQEPVGYEIGPAHYAELERVRARDEVEPVLQEREASSYHEAVEQPVDHVVKLVVARE